MADAYLFVVTSWAGHVKLDLSEFPNLLAFQKRVAALQDKMAFLSDLNTTLLTLLQNRTSHRLEWIVILLILIEVFLSVLHFVLPSHK